MSVAVVAGDVPVARVALGLTLYLDEPLVWAREGALAALHAWWEHTAAAPAARVAASSRDAWYPIGHTAGREVLAMFAEPRAERPRHLLRLQVADDPRTPSCAFAYREVDPARTERAATVDIVLPAEHPADALHALAVSLVSRWPVRAAVAGFRVARNDHAPEAAWGAAWRWSRSLLGLDVTDPERAAWGVAEKLPGVNWLTFVGDTLADDGGIRRRQLQRGPWRHDVTAQRLERGTLLTAGAAPTLGDRRRCEAPEAYAAVTQALAEHLPDPPPLGGPFLRDGAARRWGRRLLEPEAWT